MEMPGAAAPPLRPVLLLFLAVSSCCFRWFHPGVAQAAIPARYDGFVYRKGAPLTEESVVVEAFFDPLCPDSWDAWPPLKRALREYETRVSLVVHTFPLPYHDNSFFSCRALHIANKLNKSTTYILLELFFNNQGKFYNSPTHKMSRESVIQHIINLAAEAVGNSSLSALEDGFEDPKTNIAARTSFGVRKLKMTIYMAVREGCMVLLSSSSMASHCLAQARPSAMVNGRTYLTRCCLRLARWVKEVYRSILPNEHKVLLRV